MASPSNSVPQRRLRSSSAHHRSMTPSRFSSPPPPTRPPTTSLSDGANPVKRRRLSTSINTTPQQQHDEENLEDSSLQPCSVRRTYICKVCSFVSTNPREFLSHQKEFHGLKQTIRGCPYCQYATIYTHKLVRHITLVHKKTVVRSKAPPKSPSPPKLVPNFTNPLYPGSISPSTLPPPSVAPKLVQNKITSPMVLPPELEMIPVSESRKSNQSEIKVSPKNQTSMSPLPKLKFTPQQTKGINGGTVSGKPLVTKTSDKKISAELAVENCSFCSFKSVSRMLVDRHEKVSHFKKKFYRCNKCTYITNVRSRYTKHVRYHSMPYIKCELCDFSTPYKWNLDRHRKNHMDDPDSLNQEASMYRCHLCTFHTLTKQSLSGHLMNHHLGEGQGKKRRRPIEEGGFCSESDLNKSSDLSDNHNNESNEFDDIVDEQEESFENRSRKSKSSPEKNGIDSSIKPGLIKCDLCPYRAKWISEVIRHRRVHVTEKPFECPKCSFSSRWKGDLTRHLAKYHPDPEKTDLVDNIDELLDQSMMIGGAEELEVYNQEQERLVREQENAFNSQSLRKIQSPKVPEIDYGIIGQLIKGQGMKQQITAPVQLSASVQLIPTNPPPISSPPPVRQPSLDDEDKAIQSPIIRKKYQCPHCFILMGTASNFKAHLQTHAKAYCCSECNFKGNESEVIAHLKRAISINDSRHQAATVVKNKSTSDKEPENYDKYVVFETVNTAKSPPPTKNGSPPANIKRSLPSNSTVTSSAKLKMPSPKAKLGPNVIYKCKYCEFRDHNRRTILRHLQVHSTNKPFWCGICGQSSNSKNIILRHCQVRHNVSGPIIQRDTVSKETIDNKTGGKGKEKVDDKKESRAEEEEDPGFVIVETNKEQNASISKVNTASKEIKNPELENGNASSKPDKRHRCPICPYRCRKMFDLRIHSYMHKPHKGADYKCSYCPFYVTLKGSLMNHMKLHTENHDSEYTSVENISNADKASSVQDINDKESEMKQWQNCSPAVKRYSCEHCPYSTNSHTTYFYHRQFHRPSKHGIFKCNTCSYSVSRLHLLHQHERVHSKSTNKNVAASSTTSTASARPLVVNSELARPNSLVSKRQTAQDSLPILPRVWVNRDGVFKKMFKCRHCPHVSKKRTVIFEHEKMHTLREAPGSKANYHCQLCNYSCMNGGILTSHMRVHKAQNSSSYYVNDIVEEDPSTKTKWTSTPKATARKGGTLNKSKQTQSNTNLKLRGESDKDEPRAKYSRQLTYYQCDCCPARFNTLEKREIHAKCHGISLRFKCNHCDYSAKHRPHLHRHLFVHTEAYKHTYLFQNSAPKISTQINSNNMNISNNLSQISPGGSSTGVPEGKAYTCTQCPAVFVKESTLIYHLKMHDGNAKYKCDHCSYSVFNYSNLVRHARVHGIELPAEPPGSSNASQLDSSSEAKKNELEEVEATFKCPKCPAFFDKKSGFDVHISLHGSRQWFKCDRCDYSVKYEANLIRHRHLHDVHDEGKAVNSTTPLSDDVLNELNTSEFQIEVEHEPIIKVDEKQRNDRKKDEEEENGGVKRLFQCPKCPYTHPRKDAVQSHLKRHSNSGNSEARCPHCDYGSNMQSFLREHIKLHFDTSHLRQVEAFAHWEELEVWVRSGVHKTLIYRYALGEKLFTENDSRTEAIEPLTPVYKESNTKSVDVATATTVENGTTENKENAMEVDDVEEDGNSLQDDNESEVVEDFDEKNTSEEINKDDVITSLGVKAAEVINNVEEKLKEVVEEKMDEDKEDAENDIEASLDEEDLSDSNIEKSSNQIVEDKVEVEEEKEQVPEGEEENGVQVEAVAVEPEAEVVEKEDGETVVELMDQIKEVATICEPESTEEEKSLDLKNNNEEGDLVAATQPPSSESLGDKSEKMDVSEDEIIVDVCSEEPGEPTPLVPPNPSVEVSVAPEADVAVTEEVIEEGTVSMEDMIGGEELALAETCTPV